MKSSRIQSGVALFVVAFIVALPMSAGVVADGRGPWDQVSPGLAAVALVGGTRVKV